MNTIHRTYKYPIILGAKQEEKFDRWVRLSRQVYNLCIEQRERNFNGYQKYAYKEGAPTPPGKSIRPTGKYYSWQDQDKEITQLKHEFPEFAEVPAGVLTRVAVQVDQAYRDFYKNIKEKKLKGSRKIKFSNRFEDFSLKYMRGDGFSFDIIGNRNARIFGFPKCPEGIKVRYYRPIDGKVLQQIIKKEGNSWYLCVTIEKQVILKISDARPEIGLDWGCTKTIALSDGTEKMLPYDLLDELLQRKKVLQRRLKRKVGGNRNKKEKQSNNYKKAYAVIAKLDRKIANIRKYHMKMFASEIARDFSVIAVEKLKVKNMTASAKGTVEAPGKNVKAKSGLNRVILNSSPYFLLNFLKQKAAEHGSIVVEVNPKNTSRMCFKCKHVDKDNRPYQAEFVCLSCGHKDNADFNATRNVLFRAKEA